MNQGVLRVSDLKAPKTPASPSFVSLFTLNMAETASYADLPIETLITILETVGLADLRTLLLAQRVCKQWHQTIQTTSTLQELLYFRPAD